MSVRGQVTRSAQPLQRLAELREVTVRGLRDVHVGEIEPALDPVEHVPDRERPRNNLAVGGDANEPEQGRPTRAPLLPFRRGIRPTNAGPVREQRSRCYVRERER